MAENTEIINVEFRSSGAQRAAKDARSVRHELANIRRARGLENAAREAAKFAAETGRTRTAVIRLQGEVAKFGTLTSAEAKKIAKDFDRFTDSIKRSEAALKRTRISADDRFSRVSNDVGLFGDTQSNLGAIRGLAGASGATGLDQTLGIAGELFALGEEIPRLKIAIQGLPEQARLAAEAIGSKNLGMIGAIGAAAIAIKLLADQAERVRVAAQAQIDQNLRYIELINTRTAEEIRAEQESARQILEIRKQQAFEAQRIEQELTIALQREYGLVGTTIAEFNAALGTNNTELRAARDSAAAATQALSESQREFDVLNAALNDSSVAARTAAQAEAELAAARQANIDKAVDNQVRLLAQISSFDNAASVDSRVQALQDERAALQGAIDAGIASADQLKQYGDRINEINGDIATLQYLIRPVAVEREREAAALRETEDKLKALATAQERFNNDTLKLSQARVANETQNAATIAKINTDLNKRLVGLETDRTQALVKAEQDAIQGRAEALRDRDSALNEAARDAQLDREKDEREHRQRLRQIERDFNRSEAQAVADRDAVALQEAQQARDDAIRDENEGYSQRLRDIDRALAEENRTINQRYQEQRRDIDQRLQEQRLTIQQRYQEQVFAAQQAAAEQRLAEQQRFAEQQRAIQQELRLRTNQYNQEIALANAGAQAILRIEAQKQSLLVSQAQAALRTLGAYTPTSTTSTFNRNGTTYAIRANGGPLTAGQQALVNDRDRFQRESYTAGGQTALFPPGMGVFIPARSGTVNANGGGAMNVNINLDGKTIQATSRRMTLQTIDDILTKNGIN